MSYTTPEMRVGGMVMGDRILNFNGNFIIKDYKNKIESNTTFAYRVNKNKIMNLGNWKIRKC